MDGWDTTEYVLFGEGLIGENAVREVAEMISVTSKRVGPVALRRAEFLVRSMLTGKQDTRIPTLNKRWDA